VINNATNFAKARATLAELETHISRDEREVTQLRAEIERLTPDLAAAQTAESAPQRGPRHGGAGTRRLASSAGKGFNREQGAAHQTTQVERARIEQLENQLRRLAGQSDRLAVEREALMVQESSAAARPARGKRNRWRAARRMNSPRRLTAALDRSQKLRAAQFEAENRLEAARSDRERRRAEAVSLEALQKPRSGRGDTRTAEWLASSGLEKQPRLAAQLSCRAAGNAPSKRRSATISKPWCVDETRPDRRRVAFAAWRAAVAAAGRRSPRLPMARPHVVGRVQ